MPTRKQEMNRDKFIGQAHTLENTKKKAKTGAQNSMNGFASQIADARSPEERAEILAEQVEWLAELAVILTLPA